jgi:hypothetical protein
VLVLDALLRLALLLLLLLDFEHHFFRFLLRSLDPRIKKHLLAQSGNTKGGTINGPLTSCLPGLELAV